MEHGPRHDAPGSVNLATWISRSYLRTAILPLLLIELTFLAIYWVSSNFIYDRNAAAVEKISRDYLSDLAQREALSISGSLDSIAGMTNILAREARRALDLPAPPVSAAEMARYRRTPAGALVTFGGGDKSASFYSGKRGIGPVQIDKVRRLTRIDPLLRDLKETNALVAQSYFNSWDTYNRIYPYMDAADTYPADMDVRTYNFYYEADAQHNPSRRQTWTDAYLDPAGAGWMVSSIAPVYSPQRLEGVVGIDITIGALIEHVLAMNIPWKGYAILVGRDGTMLAIPGPGESDLGVREMRQHAYDRAVTSDTFKPESYNLLRRKDLAPLATLFRDNRAGPTDVTLNGRRMIAARGAVAGPGWKLLVLAPADEILSEAESLRARLQTIGQLMALALFLFYCIFLAYLYARTRKLSKKLSDPLQAIGETIAEIGAGRHDQAAPASGVTEIDALSNSLVHMSRGLAQAYQTISEQERQVSTALQREVTINAAQRRFIDMISHEFRTPLTVIDSCGQILARRADQLKPDDLRQRSVSLRRAVRRCNDVLASALQLLRVEKTGRGEPPRLKRAMWSELVAPAQESLREQYPGRTIEVGDLPATPLQIDPEMMRVAVAAVVDNAARYAGEDGHVRISVQEQDDRTILSVSDSGPGIAPEELAQVKQRFFRGTNSAGTPGAGIGLYLADQILDAHGGALEIHSEKDRGTTVALSLPKPMTWQVDDEGLVLSARDGDTSEQY
ncbi:ATP-binding protein [Rhizorhabdus sp.]|uniref:ATP-binding protein n=1 Tax=Rhizorhabdus sp. TaxID=1968843 RepID=UPI0035ADF8DA